MICLHDSKKTNFNNNGLVILSDCKSAYVKERLNDLYEYTLEYPLDSRGKWQYLVEGNIIKSSKGQLFRIYHKVKTLTGIQVNARHIFYDLLDNFLEDVRPENLNGAGAMDWILTHAQYTHPFSSMSDVSTVATKYFIRKNVVEAIMGQDGIIANWGGELVRDNFSIKLLQARGIDRGILIAYGKNIIGIEETIDLDSICTRIMPVGKDGLLLTDKYIDSPYINNFSHPKIKVVEFNDIDNETDLRTAAQNYFIDTKCDIPQFNYKIDFVELSKMEEYKHYAVLETVYVGDTVTIKHARLNINLKAKVIRLKINDITGRIEEVELGSFKPNISNAFSNLSNNIKSLSADIVQVKSDYQNDLDNATNLITGSKGGNVVIRQDENGHPYEILIMDTTDVNTAKNVWRWNISGFGYSSSGINGPYSIAITMDGHIVGTFIKALVISGAQIKTGYITSNDGKVSIGIDSGTGIAVTGGALTVKNGNNEVVIDGQYNMFKIIASGTASIGIPEGVRSGSTSVQHSLGYVPACMAYAYVTDNDYHSIAPFTRVYYDGTNMQFIDSLNITITTTRIYFDYDSRNTGSSIYIKYFLFKEAAF